MKKEAEKIRAIGLPIREDNSLYGIIRMLQSWKSGDPLWFAFGADLVLPRLTIDELDDVEKVKAKAVRDFICSAIL